MKIELTNDAKNKIDDILKTSGKEYVKLVPGSYSCCDIVFTIMAGDKEEKETEYATEDYKFLMDSELDGYYDKIMVDYITEGFAKGFNIETKDKA
ncbi:hypothetical protein [Miniphocaeibacter massiliensis]|uniref:hypothetical protein n=1 Tax=Miniphocaeibacter massiliensis TaxID=2041841 RepID=UPI000C1C1409|nr:hypothetical protein [Miniphocaeibacter massiliensis]